MSTFDNIKKISKERGYNLRQTAEKAGLSPNAIYRYNQGIEPKYGTLKAIADALSVDVSDLSTEYSSPKDATRFRDEVTHGVKKINIEELLDGTAMLTDRDGELTDSDRAALRALISTYLQTKEGRDRLKKYSNMELDDNGGENGDD